MRVHRVRSSRECLALSAALVLVLGACAPGGTTPSTGSPSTGSGNPACDLITPEIAAKVDPGFAGMGQGQNAKPPGSPAYLCSYMSKSDQGMNALSVALISPASAAEIAEAKKTPDCLPVAGIGDFACFQWTGWFRGEAGGASANTVLKAVRGNESLDLRVVATPPMTPGTPVPDGNATARALTQAAVEGGWGNGSALSVPSAPPVGPQTTTDNPVCALVSADAVKQAFGATTQAQVVPGEGSCRYIFGAPGTPGPDSLLFSIEFHPGGASLLSRPVPDGQEIEGIGDRAILIVRTDPGGRKEIQPPSDVPLTYMSLMVARGQNMAIFTSQILIPPAGAGTGTGTEQIKNKLITLVKGINF